MRTLKIGLSCFLGGFMGGIVAFSVSPYIWWLGMLVGALVGWIAYDFRGFLNAIPRAWEMAYSNKPSKEFILGLFFVFWTIGSCFLPVLIALIYRTEFWAIPVFFSIFPIVLGAIWKINTQKSRFSSYRETFFQLNGFAFMFYYFPQLIWFIGREFFKELGEYLGVVIRLLKHLFLLVHSEERLLCGTDAAIGVFIGYQFGHPIACAIAGAIAGIVNYEFLSKRLLRNALAQFRAH